MTPPSASSALLRTHSDRWHRSSCLLDDSAVAPLRALICMHSRLQKRPRHRVSACVSTSASGPRSPAATRTKMAMIGRRQDAVLMRRFLAEAVITASRACQMGPSQKDLQRTKKKTSRSFNGSLLFSRRKGAARRSPLIGPPTSLGKVPFQSDADWSTDAGACQER